MGRPAGKTRPDQTILVWLIVVFTILALPLMRLLLAAAVLASMMTLAVWICAPPRHARRGLVVCGLLMLVAAAGPVDIAFRRTGRVWVGVRPIVWGHVTKRAEASARAGDVVFAGDLMPLHPARYAVVVSW